jgi:hypothetical protein
VNYDWQADRQHPEFDAEKELLVKGQVQNGLNGGVKSTHVTLLSKSPLFAKDTLTDKKGYFTFRNFPVIDTPAFIIKAVNRQNKSFDVGITVDDITPPQYILPAGPFVQPWYINSDSTLLSSARSTGTRISQQYAALNGQLLKEVKITAKKIVKGSQNLNGPGNADIVLDETDMISAGNKTCLDLLFEKFKGFREGFIKVESVLGKIQTIKGWATRLYVQDKTVGDFPGTTIDSYPGPLFPWFFIDDKPVKFIVDGIPFGSNMRTSDLGTPNIRDIKTFLQYHSAQDIKGIELLSSDKYSSNYLAKYLPHDWPIVLKNALSYFDFSYIEITTRSGRGPVLDNMPGMYLYKPQPLIYPKEFYKPKYTVNDMTKHLPDLRSTIDWEPNIITDKTGKATISFYAADKPGTYTIIIEGTDGNGNLGYKLEQIKIESKPKTNKQKIDTR